jgi:DNA (cytosine-5)-methyltransferase 1
LERAGFEIKWQVEIDDYCTKVLEKHWPEVKRYRDVREVGKHNLEPVDLICGGFPCQPHSLAGKRKASNDERDLWNEFYRIICELRPKWVLAENVPGILSSEAGRFFGGILRDLAASGYCVEWQSIPAAAFGAPHIRERVFIVANRESEGVGGLSIPTRGSHEKGNDIDWVCKNVANTDSQGLQIWKTQERSSIRSIERENLVIRGKATNWSVESGVGRVANGVPHRVERLRGLGNAVVPQVAEYIGHCILDADENA